MEQNEITENDQLEIGKYYHCFDNKTGSHSIQRCCKDANRTPKYLGAGRIWADNDNNQALNKWKIIGPVEIPKIDSIYLCSDHHGHGFKNNCVVCGYDKSDIAL